ncbi:MAG TPA: DNA translocase FtsK, partial [Solirubrobacteraceae bacterium]|nr:DNA translocase FtsK [Solirubrobacteraceae bacterium]
MPATRRRTNTGRAPRRTPARRSRGRARGAGRGRGGLRARASALLGGGVFSLRAPELDQRQRDMLGFWAIAAGVFLGFVIYGGWDGGRVGEGLAEALGWCVGRARGLVPIALVAGGGALLARPVWPQLRPLRAGVICLAAAITMALAAGTLGVSAAPNPGGGESSWSSVFLQSHGGAVGESLYQVAHRLVQSVGVDILVLFLLFIGVTQLTGASPAGLVRGLGTGLAHGLSWLRTQLAHARAHRGDRPSDATGGADAREGAGGIFDAHDLAPPEPREAELIVRATHVEAPSRDEAEEEEEEEEEREEIPGVAASEPGAPREGPTEESVNGAQAGEEGDREEGLTPQGRFRDAHLEDPDFVWEPPDAGRLLVRSTGEQSRPDTAGQERIAASLIEALGHFGVEAKVIGTVAGPHITRYELRLAPGTKVAKVAQLKDDLAYSLAATDIRILAPIPGKQAVGVEVPNQRRRIVRLGDVYQEPPKDWSPLTVWLGKDVAGKAIGADLAKMPHLLVAGTTGAGKSGAINAMLSSVLLRGTPREVRL